GYSPASQLSDLAVHASISSAPGDIVIGGICELEYEVHIREGEQVKIRIEYGIDFVKAKGVTSRKLFLLSDKVVAGGSRLRGKRTHRWANLTTRRHYPGEHRITLLVNGCEAASTTIEL